MSVAAPGVSVATVLRDLAESRAIARKECSLTDLRSTVTRVWVSDDFAGILQCGQAPPDKFIHAKLFWPRYFNHAVYRLTYCNPGHATCNVIGGHWLKKHMRQMNLPLDNRNVCEAFQEFEELRGMHDGVRDR